MIDRFGQSGAVYSFARADLARDLRFTPSTVFGGIWTHCADDRAGNRAENAAGGTP